MYRSSKFKMIKHSGVSAALAFGFIASGTGVASASSHTSTEERSTSTGRDSWPTTLASLSAFAHEPGQGPGAGGIVTAVNGSTITISNESETTSTYSIGSATTVTQERTSATLSDLAIGQEVRISLGSASSTSATAIDIELAHVAGRVDGTNGASITLTDRAGAKHTVVVTTSTAYSKHGVVATPSDVTVGSLIFAEGIWDNTHTTLTASTVGIGRPEHGARPPAEGAPGAGSSGRLGDGGSRFAPARSGAGAER